MSERTLLKERKKNKMACEAMNSWTFTELVSAFVDLSIAYCFLCGSAFFFFASKLLALFGLCLPCPCDGLFWNPRNNNNNTQCLQRQLSDFTYEKISMVHLAVRTKSPFDRACCDDSDRETVNDRESGSVVFGAEQREFRRPRRGFRRRRSGGSAGNGKISSVRSYDTLRSDAQNAPRSPPSVSNKRNAGSEDDFYSFEAESFPHQNEEDDRSALYAELEKERSAAASAADEAMAMISRLQEEKASVEMEARQYQRMIEAKAAYDAEEMEILKEILLRREREKHFLENEVEAYRQMFSAADHEDHTPIVVKGSLDYEVTTSVRSLSRTLAFDNELDIPELDDPVSKPLEIGGPTSPHQPPELCMDKDPPESCVYDVHVISGEPKRFGSLSFNDLSKSSSDGLPRSWGNFRADDLRRNSSMSAVDYERVRLDGEVEWLRGRLRMVQKGRENLKFSAGHGEKEKLQLQLLEDIADQLREIRRLGDPGNTDRQASLPPSYSKVPSKRRRWCSGSLSINQST